MKTGENSHFEFLGQKVKILAYKCLIKLRRSWKLEEVHLIWRVMHVALGPTVVLTPEPTLWDVWSRRYEHFRKNFFLVKKSKFCLRSPPEAPETPEMDWNIPHWRPLNDLRWVWALLFWPRTFFVYICFWTFIVSIVQVITVRPRAWQKVSLIQDAVDRHQTHQTYNKKERSQLNLELNHLALYRGLVWGETK